jgi:hypothetical protein
LVSINGQIALLRQSVSTDGIADAPSTKRQTAATIDELLNLAADNGVAEIATRFWNLKDHFAAPTFWPNGWGFRKRVDGRYLVVLSIFPTAAVRAGAAAIAMSEENLAKVYGKEKSECQGSMDRMGQDVGQFDSYSWGPWKRVLIRTMDEAQRFIAALAEFTGVPLEQPSVTPSAADGIE